MGSAIDSPKNGALSARQPSKRRSRFRYSLTVGIIVTIFFSSLASAIFMHTAWRVFVVRSTSDLSTRINQEIFFSIRREVSDLFRDVINTQGTLYNIFRTDLAALGDTADIKSLYLNTALYHPNFSWISYGHPNGDFFGVQRIDDNRVRWHVSNYDQATERATRFIEEYRIDGRELVLVDQSTLVNNYYAPARSWFRNAIAPSVPTDVWTNVYVFATDVVPGINSSIALRDPVTNEVQGVVSIAVTLGRLSDRVAEIRVSTNGVAFVINDQQELIAYRDKNEVVSVDPNDERLTLRTLASSNDVRLRVVNEVMQDPTLTFDLQAPDNDGEIFVTSHVSSENDQEYSIFLELLSDVSGSELNLADLGWYFGITVPTVDILGAIDRSSRQLLFVTYAIIAAIISVVFVFIRFTVVKPIKQIANQAEYIRQFNLESVKLPSSSLSEIDLLTQSISRMNTGLSSFRKYVPTKLVQRLAQRGLEAKLGGAESNVTIFFCDIAHFTRISEIMRENIIGHLDTYFTHLSDIINNHDGTIDKYIGDAIMAFWGAPNTQADHAVRACTAALHCAQMLRRLRLDWESKGEEQLFARFGLNSGKVLVGNFGSSQRMSYTAIGDPVNVASRLEALNKVYGTEILIGDSTYGQVHRHFVTRKLDRVAVYGRLESIEIYELIAIQDGNYHPDYYQWVTIFEEGLQHYRNQRWKEAIKAFYTVHEQREGEDNASLLFIKRCQHLARQHVPQDWDGTFVLQSK